MKMKGTFVLHFLFTITCLLISSAFSTACSSNRSSLLPDDNFSHDDNGNSDPNALLMRESQRCLHESTFLQPRPPKNCSCSRPCTIYDNCCTERFSNKSQNVLAKLFLWPVHAIRATIRRSKTACVRPAIALNSTMMKNRFRFSEDVPGFFKSPTCDLEETTLAPTPILAKWPVFEVRTGLVFSSISEAKCIGKRLSQISDHKFAKTSEIEYWPTYRVICDADPSRQALFENFDPFNPGDSKLFYEKTSLDANCIVELYYQQSENASFDLNLAFCESKIDTNLLCDKNEEVTETVPKTKPKGRYLMAFRLLMDFSVSEQNQPTFVLGENEVPLRFTIYRYTVLGCMAVSILSLAIVLAIYVRFPQLQNLPGKMTMCLSSALFVALACYAVGVLGIPKIWYPACFSIGVAIHFCFLVSFCFGSCLAFDIWRVFYKQVCDSRTFPTSSAKLFIRYNIIAWGFPALVTLFSISVEFITPLAQFWPRPRYSTPATIISNTSESTWVCWMMNQTAVMAYFNIPIGICLVISIIFFIMSIVLIARASVHSTKVNSPGHGVSARRRFVIYLKLSTIMGVTWLFGLIAALAQIEFLWVPYALANALQGFYICLSFVCTRRVTRLLKAWYKGEDVWFDFSRPRSSFYSSSGLFSSQFNLPGRRTTNAISNGNINSRSSFDLSGPVKPERNRYGRTRGSVPLLDVIPEPSHSVLRPAQSSAL